MTGRAAVLPLLTTAEPEMAVTNMLLAEGATAGAEKVNGLFGLLNIARLMIFADVDGLTSVLRGFNVTCVIGLVGIGCNPCNAAAELSAFESTAC